MEVPSGCTIAQKGSQGQHRPPSCSNHKLRRQGSAEPRRELRALSRLAARQRRQQPEPELGAATTTERGGEGGARTGRNATPENRRRARGEAYHGTTRVETVVSASGGPHQLTEGRRRAARLPDRTIPSGEAAAEGRARAEGAPGRPR
ncbi:uncharacterized protein LOC116469348 [Hylobates moloch]|uniref:uncharacterized protein LOC116469348 n=1 Tax=Hylobates moloch TaxID=81572 RepID=UPI002674B1FE|nr:uncharacterized protein LOC116469348 [Hylobates moloch]